MAAEWTQHANPDRLAPMLMLQAIAMLMWTAAGAAEARARPTARATCRSKGHRISLIRIGQALLRFVDHAIDWMTIERLAEQIPRHEPANFPWLRVVPKVEPRWRAQK